MMKYAWMGAVALVAGLATPALADVKAGVDAWNRGEYKKAVDEWRPLAVKGDADAQYNLGQAYKLGRGVPVDLGMAEEWYRKAAAQGHPQAEDNYGLALFQNGKRDAALPFLQKSAGRGEARAQYVLSTMYFNGDVVKRDYVRAYALMTRAVAAGLPQAPAKLGQMDQFIGLQDRQKGIALARQLETDEGRARSIPTGPAVASRGPAPRPVQTTDVPPSRDVPLSTADTTPPSRPRPRPATPTPRSAPPKPATVAERPTPARSGAWRAQLGSFRDADNAKTLFATLQGKGAVRGLTPYMIKAGPLTKLQVGPFSTPAEAAQACSTIKRAGSECVPTKG